jgi:hypothetical protein
MDIEDDDERYRKNRGIPQIMPVLMEDDNISVKVIEQMVEEAPIVNSRAKNYYSQIQKDLEELDEVVQEFSRKEEAQKYVLYKQYKSNFQSREVNTSSRTNKILMATMREASNKMNQKGLLTREDIS